MDQGTLKELNKRSSQQEWKKRQKKKRLRIWTETERKVKKIKIKLNNCALRIPRALFFPITLALASAVPFVQFRYLLFLVFFRFDSCRFALPAFSFRSAMSRLLRASVETQMAHSQTHKLTSRQTRKRTHDTDEAHSKTNARELPVLPTGLRMQASWQPWSAADASACTVRKVGVVPKIFTYVHAFFLRPHSLI